MGSSVLGVPYGAGYMWGVVYPMVHVGNSVLGVPYGAGCGVWCGGGGEVWYRGINGSVVCIMTIEYTTEEYSIAFV